MREGGKVGRNHVMRRTLVDEGSSMEKARGGRCAGGCVEEVHGGGSCGDEDM